MRCVASLLKIVRKVQQHQLNNWMMKIKPTECLKSKAKKNINGSIVKVMTNSCMFLLWWLHSKIHSAYILPANHMQLLKYKVRFGLLMTLSLQMNIFICSPVSSHKENLSTALKPHSTVGILMCVYQNHSCQIKLCVL